MQVEQIDLTSEAFCWTWSFLQLCGSLVEGWRLSFPTRGTASAVFVFLGLEPPDRTLSESVVTALEGD